MIPEQIAMYLPLMIIMTFFSILWTIKYPTEHWEYLTFRSGEGVSGFFVSVVITLYDLGAIYTVGFACYFVI
jgi:flagellar biosynthesis protein FliR